MVMADISRQQKLASAKKKLKKFQKTKSPTSDPVQENSNLSKEILDGIKNNHIFQTPSLKKIKDENPAVNHKLNFPSPKESPVAKISSSNNPPSINSRPTNLNFPLTSTPATTKNNEDINEAITSYKRSNQQLTDQVNEQRKQIIQLQEKFKKESSSAHQLTDQRALKEQLEVHIQTIGILVSEKSELQSNISTIQKKLGTKEKDFNDISDQLNNSRQQLVKLEKLVSQLQTNENHLKQINKDVVQERDRISSSLYQAKQNNEEAQLQNSELNMKIKAKVEECADLLNQVNELQEKLQKNELIIQQLSSNSMNPALLEEYNVEKNNLMKTINDQKSIIDKLVADKVVLSEKNLDMESHYDIQIEELKNKINTMENEKVALYEKAQSMSLSVTELQQELDKSKTQLEKSNIQADNDRSDITDKLKSEKETLEQELDVQIQENRRISRVIIEQNEKIESLELSISQLNADSLDKSSLLNQIQSDKETISRALQQNKMLKEQIEELQEAFVKMSTSSADLTTKLQSEQHGSKDVAEKLSSVQLELEETRVQLSDKSNTCEQLDKQLCRFKEELNNVQMKLAAKEMDLDLVNTELETIRHEMTRKQEEIETAESANHSALNEKLRKELSSAQETINTLSYQNEELREKIHESQTVHEVNAESSTYYYNDPSNMEDPAIGEIENELTEEEQHARNWEEYENDETESSDGDDSGYTNEAIQYTQAEVEALQTSLNDLQEERIKIVNLLQKEREKAYTAMESIEEHVELKVQQMLKIRERELQEHFYEQTEALHSKVKSLQDALEVMRKNESIADFDMTSDGITMPQLKNAFTQLQNKYKAAMDTRALLSDRIEQLEHTNMKLETETETIGEYIALYQTQRQALKEKFAEKDEVITKLSNEHARMQGKVTQLHHLVLQILSERSGIESKNKALQELVNRRLALQSGKEASEIPNLEYNLDNLFGEMTLTPEEENELTKDNIIVDDEELTRDLTNDQTAQQILNLFEQLETTGEGYQFGWLSPAARKHSFQPCKNCSDDLMHI